MSAQVGGSIVLGYGAQGVQQIGSAVLLSYSPPVPAQRRLTSGLSAPWRATTIQSTDLRAPMVRTTEHDVSSRAPWRRGHSLQIENRQPWHVARRQDARRAALWGRYSRTPTLSPRAQWGVSARRDEQVGALWGSFAARLALEPLFPWGVAQAADQLRIKPWGSFAARLTLTAAPSWAVARTADATRLIPWLRFSRALDPGWGVVVPPGGIGPDEPAVIVPIRKFYMTINSLSLRRVDGDVPIPADGFAMSLDTDSWTWSWSASLPADALHLVQPDSSGVPVEVEALVNGVPYRLCAEGISSQREFPKARIRVQWRGTAAVLDSPYAPVLNHGNAAPRTAQQLMGDVLTLNGVGIGWAVDWALTDWLVPANVWAHQGAYIGAILDIAQAAGGYVQPHNTAQTLRILPRYPAAPWNWAATTPDFELPAAVTEVEGIDWVRKPAYSRVFVSGVGEGRLGEVTRAGTAGNVPAPMVTHPLITHADAARQRGLAILSDSGHQARVTLKLPVLVETGLIKPGQFVRYVDGPTSRLGLVRSTSLEWQFPTMRQSISLETHIS